MNDNKLTSEGIEEVIIKVDNSMTQEGMPVTSEIKENLRKCLRGESTTEIEVQKVIERYKKIYE